MKPFSFKQKLIYILVPRFGWILAWILYLLNRNEFILKNKNIKGAIVIFWHGEILMMPFLYRKFREQAQTYIIASNHFDGGLIARMCEIFGMESIRGSTDSGNSNHKGVRALLSSIKVLKEGFNVGIAIDGPRGPYHQISDGMIMMAQKTKKPIIFCRIKPRFYIEFKTWDKFRLPLPFGKICYHMYESFYVDSALSLEQARQEVKQKIESMQNLAEN